MAVSYKDIIITPYRSDATYDPKIEWRGANTTVNTSITTYVYPTSNGTLSFEGSAGQLFSITNDLTGSIYSVNDVSGIPSIDVNADGTVSLIPYSGNLAIGSFSSSGYKAQITGTFNVSGLMTQNGSPVWTAANDGSGSGLDADTIDGYHASASVVGSNIVVRDANGYIFGNYLNTTDDASSGTITYVMAKFGDNYLRSASAAKVATFISGQSMNISGNSAFLNGFTSSNAANPVAANTMVYNGISYVNTDVGNILAGQSDGALYSQAYSTGWAHQIYGDYRSGQIAVRGRRGDTNVWSSWRVVLDSSNYTNYMTSSGISSGKAYFFKN